MSDIDRERLQDIPVITAYEVVKNKKGDEYRVRFACPKCGKPVLLQEARLERESDSCKHCEAEFVVSAQAPKDLARKRREDKQRKRELEEDFANQLREQQEQRQHEIEQRLAKSNATDHSLRFAEYDAGAFEASDASKLTEPCAVQPEGNWQSRYPYLAKYLNWLRVYFIIGHLLLAAFWLMAGVYYFVKLPEFTTADADSLTLVMGSILFWIGGFALLWISYVISMAGIEFIRVFCSTEQETVHNRQLLTRLVVAVEAVDQGQ